jgi:mevalonate kinase
LSGNGDPSVTASAPGKVIITGEHFVVHGAYALAASINRRVRVSVSSSEGASSTISSRGVISGIYSDSDRSFPVVRTVAKRIFSEFGKPKKPVSIVVASEIPAGSGLGSSAAVSVATAAATARYLGKEPGEDLLSDIALEGERAVHGSPSGIDVQASMRGGMILFSKNSGTKPIPMDRAIQLLVVFSGKQRRTSELISKVAQKKKEFPGLFKHLVDSASFFGLQAVDAATTGDLPYLGAIMNLMETSLSWIGASNKSLDNLLEQVQTDDVFGAKITGAGGGGSVIALPKPERAEALLREVASRYSHSFLCKVPEKGLLIEEG